MTEGNSIVGIKILALVGSLRSASINRQIAELATTVTGDDVTVTIFEGLADLPFYNEEIDDVMNAEAPALAPVAALRGAAGEADAALVVTPEYNGSYPAVIKNAVDWLSRPFGDGALKGKPLAVIGGSFGQYGGVWAHDDTRKSFGIAGARVVEDLKLSVPFKTLEGKAPAEHAELTENVRDIVGKLAAEVG
ncbi:MAG: NAD(P)H-dependent oxidoreductase [Mycobacterium sp.]|uniref:NAD(P)H-dependent oxidoreductase n=1 Tax=Mycobacterium sp. TaxID=1785 RepID=UPI001EC5FF7E|nr:NAD(P)H-dependent oxidoreductase [Mycobacterium sp.]MBV8788098.1 NAD(P)H-dependent oxidoreductase [Mycobacterium sp.]